MATILVAHAPAAKKRARRVTEKLRALGYKVEVSAASALAPHPRRQLDEAVARAGRVLVLWSKEAPAAPGVLAAASRAKAAGKLSLARLDAAVPPILLRAPEAANLSAWSGREEARDWRRLIVALPKAGKSMRAAKPVRIAAPLAAPASPARKKSGAGWVIGIVLALVAAAGAGIFLLLF